MIYLASPYSHPDAAVRAFRYHSTAHFVASQLRRGIPLMSPIVYGHYLSVNHGLPFDAASWAGFNTDLLLRSQEMWVLQLDGWEQSRGVQAELDWADEHDLPVQMKVPADA